MTVTLAIDALRDFPFYAWRLEFNSITKHMCCLVNIFVVVSRFLFYVEHVQWLFDITLLDVPDVGNHMSEILDVSLYIVCSFFGGHKLEDYLEASFLLRFIGVEFIVSSF